MQRRKKVIFCNLSQKQTRASHFLNACTDHVKDAPTFAKQIEIGVTIVSVSVTSFWLVKAFHFPPCPRCLGVWGTFSPLALIFIKAKNSYFWPQHRKRSYYDHCGSCTMNFCASRPVFPLSFFPCLSNPSSSESKKSFSLFGYPEALGRPRRPRRRLLPLLLYAVPLFSHQNY